MSSSAAKKDDSPALPETLDLSAPASTDREQGLSQNFQDPSLEDLIPSLAEGSAPGGVMEEAVEAVQELLGEAQAGDLNLGQPGFDPDPMPAAEAEPSMMISVAGAAAETDSSPAQWEMAEKLFQLVVCEHSFDDLVEVGLTAIMGALGAQAGAVLEQDQEQQNYFFRASVGGGDPEKVKAFRVPFHKGIVGHVGESRRPTLLRDLEEDQKQMRAISMSVGFEAKTCMAAPILIGGQVYGVIELFNRRQGGFFTEHDLRLLEEGTRMLAKVLEVRFLMAELVRRGE